MAYVILTLLVMAGAYFLYCDRELIRLGLRSYSWPSTEGTIVDTKDQSFVAAGVRWPETAYGYVYNVEGHTYHSTNFCFGGWSVRTLAFYRIGERVKVYFDPGDPQQCVLRRGVTFGALFGVVLLMVAAGYALWAL